MSFDNTDLSFFSLRLTRAGGREVAGAEVRLIATDGANYINIVTGGVDPAYTNEVGTLFYGQVPAGSLLPQFGPYIIRILAEGFAPFDYTLPASYSGPARIVLELSRSATLEDGYALSGEMPLHRSSMYSTGLTALTPHTSPWEIIQFVITRNADPASVLEVPVLDDDGEGGTVTGDLRSRADLLPVAHLVPDGQVSLVDDDFSAVYIVTAKSLTDAGDADYVGTLTYFLANMAPASGNGDAAANDLSAYALPNPAAPVKWISQLTRPVVFRGYYADVMIWLVDKSLSYQLITRYYDGAGTQVGADAVATLPGDSRVQRIRLDADPAAAVRHATLQVYAGSAAYSERLTVDYRG